MGRYYNGDIEGKFWFGIQPTDDASFFGKEYEDDIDEETGEINEGQIVYAFFKKDKFKVEKGIKECRKMLKGYKRKIDTFFKKNDCYTDKQLGKYLKISEAEAKTLLGWYARLELGNKIFKCLNEKGRCYFTGEC